MLRGWVTKWGSRAPRYGVSLTTWTPEPRQTRSWLTSHDLDSWEKATDVCALLVDQVTPDDLVAKVMALITDCTHKAKPLRWTYDSTPLKAA